MLKGRAQAEFSCLRAVSAFTTDIPAYFKDSTRHVSPA